MAEGFFQLIFKGKLLSGKDVEKVKKDLASSLKLNEEQVDGLFSGKRIVIKKRADDQTVEKFRSVFKRAGAVLEVEPLPTDEQSPPHEGIAGQEIEDGAGDRGPDYLAIIVFIATLTLLIALSGYLIWNGNRHWESVKRMVQPVLKILPIPKKEYSVPRRPTAAKRKAPEPPRSTPSGKDRGFSKADYRMTKKLHEEGVKYVRAGNYEKAESLFQKQLEIMLEKAGKNHPGVPAVMNDLAYSIRKQGRLDEAERMYLEVIKAYEEMGKSEALGVAVACEGLAAIYNVQEKSEIMEPLYRRAMKIWEKVRGPDNGNTLAIKERLATLLERLGRQLEAEDLRANVRDSQRRYRESKKAVTGTAKGKKARMKGDLKGAIRIGVSISKDFVPVGRTVAAVSGRSSESLSNLKPEAIVKEPEYRGKSRKYGKLLLGTRKEKTYYYAFDIDSPHPVLYFDMNQNGDLSDDGPPLKNQGSGLFATTIKLPMNRLIKELDRREDFNIWLFTNKALWPKGYIRHYSRTQMKGTVRIDARSCLAYIAEREINDADFTNDSIYIDLNDNGKIEYRSEFIGHRSVALIGGKQYWFDINW